MKHFFHIPVLTLILAIKVSAAPVDLSAPSGTLGVSNPYGYLTLWREYGDVDFGNDLKLPLRSQFSSQRQTDSVCLGKGWLLPLTEASAYLKREKMLTATLICGKTMYLRKDTTQINTFYTLDKEWKGVINGKNINISREDGWNLHYENGRIKTLKTDTGRTLTWVYSGAMAVEIKEEGSPSTPFKLDLTSNGTHKGIYVNGKLHSFTLDKRPKVQSMTGKNLVTSFDAALHSWKLPEGAQEIYQFEVTEEVQPNLKVTDLEAMQTTYVWDAASGHIVSDGKWTYHVGKVASEFELPELRRVNKVGNEEFVKMDNRRGIEERASQNSGNIRTEIIKTPGPLYGKVSRIVEIEDGKETVLVKFSYDESGILLRQIDDRGLITSFIYNKNGTLKSKSTSLSKDPENLSRLKTKEQGLLREISVAVSEDEKAGGIIALAEFYLFQMRDEAKADLLISQLDRRHSYAIRVQRIDNDENLSPLQRVSGYKKLITEYPEHQDDLNFLIKLRTEESKNEKKNS